METQTIVIRRGTAEDAGLIADISRRTFYDSFAADNEKSNMEKFMNGPFAREKLMAEVEEQGSLFLLAYAGDNPVGYAKMEEARQLKELKDRRIIEVERLYAVKDRIGKGVGRTLMQACMDIAAERKKEVVWLGVWEHNHRAIAFYHKWGFEKFSEHIFLLGEDQQSDWLMKKELN